MTLVAAVLAATAGCTTRPPSVIASRLVPSVVVGQFEQHTDASIAPPIREAVYETPPVPLEPKTEQPLPREVMQPPAPAVPRVTLPDEVVLRLLETGRARFVYCFKKAYAVDATVRSFKVRVHVELDPAGTITSVNADTTDGPLAECLTRAAAALKFPASDAPVAVELPLFYQVQ
jgi:hypothetical protein